MDISQETREKIELIRAQVRPRVLILVTVAFFVFGFSDIPVREQVVDTFQWAFVGGIAWYFPERGILKIIDRLQKSRESKEAK